MEQIELKKRKRCFIQKPQVYGVLCDICGGENLHWSEFYGLIWCYDCEIDTKGTGGIFNGPVPVGAAQLMGLCFDEIDLETREVIKFNTEVDKKG